MSTLQTNRIRGSNQEVKIWEELSKKNQKELLEELRNLLCRPLVQEQEIFLVRWVVLHLKLREEEKKHVQAEEEEVKDLTSTNLQKN